MGGLSNTSEQFECSFVGKFRICKVPFSGGNFRALLKLI